MSARWILLSLSLSLSLSVCGDKLKSIYLDSSHKKLSRSNAVVATIKELKKQVGETHPSVSEKDIEGAFWDHLSKEAMRSVILDHQRR